MYASVANIARCFVRLARQQDTVFQLRTWLPQALADGLPKSLDSIQLFDTSGQKKEVGRVSGFDVLRSGERSVALGKHYFHLSREGQLTTKELKKPPIVLGKEGYWTNAQNPEKEVFTGGLIWMPFDSALEKASAEAASPDES